MMINKILILFFLLFISIKGFATTQAIYWQKLMLEEKVQHKIGNSLGTVLADNQFLVDVEAEVDEPAAPNFGDNKGSGVRVTDSNLADSRGDYIAFSNRHAAVKNTEVWDGHDEYPHQPGHIWFSFVPSTNIRSIIDETESSIGAGDGLGLEFKLQNLSNLSNWFIEESEIIDFIKSFAVNADDFNFMQYIDAVKMRTEPAVAEAEAQ